MELAINFYELKTQLADLGFREPALVDDLRAIVLGNLVTGDIYTRLPGGAGEMEFGLAFQKSRQGSFELSCITGSMINLVSPEQALMQYFSPDVPAKDMSRFLNACKIDDTRDNPFTLIDKQQVNKYLIKHEKIMELRENYDQLKEKLEQLGFNNTQLNKSLKEALFSGEKFFYINYQEPYPAADFWSTLAFDFNEKKKAVELYNYCAGLYKHANKFDNVEMAFMPDVTKDEACQAMGKLYYTPFDVEDFNNISFNKKEVAAFLAADNPDQIIFFNHLNSNEMNTQNVEFLKKSLLNLGFSDKVNDEMEKQINAQAPEFKLAAQHEFNQKKVDYILHFKAGENAEMYFLNKFDATLKNKDGDISQSFYINKGNGITAKEAFNLMEGRAVHKQLFTRDGEKYTSWLQLDNDKANANGNKEFKKFSENYGYDPEKVLEGKGIKEMNDPDSRDNLMRSLKKGNSQQLTVERDGKEQKYFISANPQYKTVDVQDHQMKKIKREELLAPGQTQAKVKKEGQQQKEELPAKKHSRKNKLAA